MITYLGKEYACPMEMTLDLIGGKWKALILWHLAMDGTLRFGMLRKRFPKVTQKMLTQQLRELERDGLVRRKVYQEVPPKVEYSLTEIGSTLLPMLQALNEWGQAFAKEDCPTRKLAASPAGDAAASPTGISTARGVARV